MNLRYTLSFLRVMRIPGLYAVMKDWQASVRVNFIFAAYESGLLNSLNQPCDRKTLIEEMGVKRPELLDALLEVGLATKELAVKNGRFLIKGKRSKALTGASGDMLAAMIQATVTYYRDAYLNAAQRMRGGELGEDLDDIGDIVARFSKVMDPIIKRFLSSLVREKDPMAVLDVGCGSGVLLRRMYQINRHAKGMGIDSDEAVVDQAKRNISEWGLADRFQIHHGDIRHFTEEAGPFDLITLINILYYFTEEDRYELINNLRKRLFANGILAIVMSFHSRGKDMASANLNMVNHSLKGLTPLPDLEEIISLLEQCGFSEIEVHRFLPGSTFFGIAARHS